MSPHVQSWSLPDESGASVCYNDADALGPPLMRLVLFLYLTSSRGIFATFPKLSTLPTLNLTLAQEFNLAPPSVPVPGKPPAPPADLSKFDTWYVNVHDLNLVQIGGREQNQWRSLPESRGRVEINVAAYRSAVRPGSESYPLLYFFNSFAV